MPVYFIKPKKINIYVMSFLQQYELSACLPEWIFHVFICCLFFLDVCWLELGQQLSGNTIHMTPLHLRCCFIFLFSLFFFFYGRDAVQTNTTDHISLNIYGLIWCTVFLINCSLFFALCIMNNFQIIQASYTTLHSIGKGCDKRNWKC